MPNYANIFRLEVQRTSPFLRAAHMNPTFNVRRWFHLMYHVIQGYRVVYGFKCWLIYNFHFFYLKGELAKRVLTKYLAVEVKKIRCQARNNSFRNPNCRQVDFPFKIWILVSKHNFWRINASYHRTILFPSTLLNSNASPRL